MTYGYGYPPPPPPPPPRSGADLGISIAALILTLVGGAVGGFLGLFMMAFTDYCPPETCNLGVGITVLFSGLAVAALVAVIGTVLTIVALTRRTRAWPLAVGTLVLTGLACVLSLAGYGTAIGW